MCWGRLSASCTHKSPPRSHNSGLSRLSPRTQTTLLKPSSSSSPDYESTLILVVCNTGYRELLRNWMCNAQRLGLKFLVGLADPEIARWMEREHGEVETYPLFEHAEVSAEGEFMSSNFFRIVWRAMELVRELLDSGISVFFIDVDVHLLQDPHLYLSSNCDLVYQQNHCGADAPARTAMEVTEPNSGLYLVKSRWASKQFLSEILLNKPADRKSGEKYSHAERVQIQYWEHLKRWYGFQRAVLSQLPEENDKERKKHVAKFCAADSHKFATGWALERDNFSIIKSEVIALHINCITGRQNKIDKLRNLSLWCP
mmetsp:Transcript_40187/g.126462  ORF Transcript_40187/g.126462 Transcript_40187/m.126462 type:complete len:314 (-) Transcript_40187:73-1014(-)